MAEQIWVRLLEATQQNVAGSDQAFIEQLASAVAESDLPPSLLERIRVAVGGAVQRAWQHDTDRAVRITLAVSALHTDAAHRAQSWGFFVVEKRLEQTRDRRIEVLLYPEGH